MDVVVGALNDQSQIFGTGFKVDGEKYTVIRADDSSLLGKKVRFSKLLTQDLKHSDTKQRERRDL